MKAQLFNLAQKLLGIFDKAIDAVSNSVSDPKKFLVTVILIVIALDVIFMGSFGFIAFLLTSVTSILGVVKAGGWQLVVILLVIVLLRK